jgi:hypothetical protein
MVFPRIDFESLAALVVCLLGGLSNNQATLGIPHIQATSIFGRGIRAECRVIGLEIEPKQRQTKVALSLKRPMAFCRIAPESSEQWDNVLLKVGYSLRITLSKPLGCGANSFVRCDGIYHHGEYDHDVHVMHNRVKRALLPVSPWTRKRARAT